MLIAEEQPQRKPLLECLIQQPDGLGSICLHKRFHQLLMELAVRGRAERLHAGRDVVIAEMQNRELHRRGLLGDL